MYIIGLNRATSFYFISREEERHNLESKGIMILKGNFDCLSAAANYMKELNDKHARARLNSVV